MEKTQHRGIVNLMERLERDNLEVVAIAITETLMGTVMVKRDDDNHPFIVWRFDERGECFWGNYIQTRKEAFEDFVERTEFKKF